MLPSLEKNYFRLSVVSLIFSGRAASVPGGLWRNRTETALPLSAIRGRPERLLTSREREREREGERAAEELKARIRDNPIVGEHVDWCDIDLGGVNVFFFVTSTVWRWCYGIMVASSELSEWWA